MSEKTPTESFNYSLPPEAIAQTPLPRRDDAKLLVDQGAGHDPLHRQIHDLPDLLSPGDLLVLNNTRVMPARLFLQKPTGAKIELLVLEVEKSETETSSARALVRPSRRVAEGSHLLNKEGVPIVCVGEKLTDGTRRIFGIDTEISRMLESDGEVPLPPYIKNTEVDPERYQTIYAKNPASAAAPTAGLHLTEEVLKNIASRQVDIVYLELSVGMATFSPMSDGFVENHKMHYERYEISESVFEKCKSAARVVAVGTTVVRALENAALTGHLRGSTDLFIRPGFEFQVVDRLLTNFHLPKSTLLVLLAAFMGDRHREIYEIALSCNYRFLSFGDAMITDRAT